MAIVGSRPTRGAPARDHAAGPGRPRPIPGIGKKLAERVIFELKEKVAAAGVAAAEIAVAGDAGVARTTSSARSRPSATRCPRRARPPATALQMAGVGASLEDRVKAALRVLVRD